jgi:hypothetical protein
VLLQQDVVVPVEAMKPPFKGIRKKEMERLANQIFFPITGVFPCASMGGLGRHQGTQSGKHTHFAHFGAGGTSQTAGVLYGVLCCAARHLVCLAEFCIASAAVGCSTKAWRL